MFPISSRMTLALAGALMAAAALAAPVGAAEETGVAWIAHGIPDARVDVCVNGDTVRTDFRYGTRFRTELPALTRLNVKIRAHVRTGACTGPVLIREILSVEPGTNITILATIRAREPQLVHWANSPQLTDCIVASTVTVHHEAKAGTMLFFLTNGDIPVPVGFMGGGLGITVARNGTAGPIPIAPGPNLLAATPLFGQTPNMPPTIRMFAELTRYQLVLVGTNAGNYRWILYGDPLEVC